MSMRKKILIPMAVVAVVCAAVIGLLGVYVVRLFVGGFNDEQLSRAHVIATTIIDDYTINAERASMTVAKNDQLINAMQTYLAGGDYDPLVEIATSLMESTGVDFLTVTDTDGTVLVRTHEPGNAGDSVAYQSNIKNALQGKRYATMEEGTAVKLSIRCGTPVYSRSNELVGVISLGYRLDQNTFAEHIKHLTNTEVAVYLHNTQISSTVSGEEGARAGAAQASDDVRAQVLEGSDYIGRAKVLDKDLYAFYSPLRDAEGAVLGMLAVGLDTSAMDARMVQDTWIMCGVVALLGVLSLFVSQNIASRLSRPIIEISDQAKQLAIGDVSFATDTTANLKTKDEVGVLASEFREMIRTISEQADILSTIANGDYSVSIPVRSAHDVINEAINRMIDRNNDMLSEINASAAQVSTGSKQIAIGAQSLAKGAVEQASAIEELSASMNKIADKTKQTADVAKEAAALSGTIRDSAEKGDSQVDYMMQAVQEICNAGNQVENVIKVIEDIAFQTNLLALNAAVEAARAGQHGKSFAVVAEEVRSLAGKSAVAAKNTSELIRNAIAKANLGLQIATETSTSLKGIIGAINRSAEIVTQIAQASDEQASAIAQINIGIDQVAEVVQNNSATAQESAAASEEMNSQSDMLAQLISQFKLKDDDMIPENNVPRKAVIYKLPSAS